MSVGFMTVENL